MGKSLIDHAQSEFEILGFLDHKDPEARKVASDTMALVRRFEKQNHNERTAQYVAQFFGQIVSMTPLSALTDDPKQWEKFEIERKNTETGKVTKIDQWVSKRCPRIMSEDGGKNWYDASTGQKGESLSQTQLDEEIAKMKQKEGEDEKKAKAEKATANVKADAPAKTDEPTPKPKS